MTTTRFSLILLLFFTPPICRATEPIPRYEEHIAPFFAKYCTECHNAKRPRGGLNLETYQGLQKGSDNGPVFVAGNADRSQLLLTLQGKKKPFMPPEKVTIRPRPEEIAVVRAWINAGAKGTDITSKIVLPKISSRVKPAAPIMALAYLPKGQRLLAGRNYSVIDIDTTTGNLLDRMDGFSSQVTAIACSHDGKNLAVASGIPGAPATIHLFRVPPLNKPWTNPRTIPNAHTDVIQRLAFHPNGQTLITCGYDRQVKIWHTVTAKLRATLKEHSDSIYGLAFRPDGKLFATCAADRAVKVWESASGKLLYTLGEATDWLYTVAWSPDGQRLAAGGVDKSIRVWKVDGNGGEVEHSVFAHQGPVVQLAYSPNGKRLVSISEDRTVKIWRARKMIEEKVYRKHNDSLLTVAMHPNGKQIALGRFDGALLLIDVATGKVQQQPLPTGPRIEKENNDSPRAGQNVGLPTTIHGTLTKAGDVDYFRFNVRAGQELGVHITPAKVKGKQSFEPFLQLTDATGSVLAKTQGNTLGYKFPKTGTYALGIRDREFNGNRSAKYQLKLGRIPIVTAVYPLGVQRGKKAKVTVTGVHLGEQRGTWINAIKAKPGSKLPVTIKTPWGSPLETKQVIVGEFPEINEVEQQTATLTVPGTANGRIGQPGDTDLWRFSARKGHRIIVEVNSRRLGSDLDSYIEILDESGRPIPRATLRSLAKTHVTFRNHNSVQANIRIDAWSELAVNDYLWVGHELMRIRRLPTHPDSDCVFWSRNGRRLSYLGTTPTYHTKDEPMYKVAVHPPGTKFAPNGFPIIHLYYRNDDGPGLGRDSRLVFDPPANGNYQIRIGDTRQRGGSNFGYRLTIRPPRPSYSVELSPASPSVWQGSALPITVTAKRIDEFSGPIHVRLENLPPGFHAPDTTIPGGEENTTLALWANTNAVTPKKAPPLKLIATATIAGQTVRREVRSGQVKAVKTGDIVTRTEQSSLTLTPGGRTKLTVHVERRNGFKGRIPIEVLGMPHGVKVLDLGLNGILITEKETQRTMVFYCQPWVQPQEHPIVISARREGRNTRHAAKSVLLRVR